MRLRLDDPKQRSIYESHFLSVGFGWVALISCTFVGDFFVFNIPGFAFCYISVIFSRFILKVKIDKVELASQYVLAVALVVISLANSTDLNIYYYSFVFSMLYINCIPLVLRLLVEKKSFIIIFMIISFLTSMSIIGFLDGGARNSFLFGPNVYYRIIGVLVLASMLTSILTIARHFLFPLLFGLGVMALALSGSRGATIVFGGLAIFYLVQSFIYTEGGKSIRSFLIIFAPITAVFLSMDIISRSVGRLIYFASEGASFQARLSFLEDFFNYTPSVTSYQVLFGDGESRRVFDFYPHNIIIEMLVYNGLILTIPVLITLLIGIGAIFFSPRSLGPGATAVLFVLPISIGSLFSGSLLEAYPMLACGVFLMFHSTLRFDPNPAHLDATQSNERLFKANN